MTRLIDAEALKKDIEHLHSVYAENKDWFYTEVLYHIDNAPTIEPERPKGKWGKEVSIYGWDGKSYQCSVCGRSVHLDPVVEDINLDYPFCHCGADMRGKEE